MGGPATMLDANRSDPFESFKIVGGRRGHQLWDHGKLGRSNSQLVLMQTVYDGTCTMFRVMIEIGFLDLVRETIALSQMLSASAWHLVHRLQCGETGEDAKYSMITTQSLQQRLSNLATGTSNEVITTVLAFAAYAVCVVLGDGEIADRVESDQESSAFSDSYGWSCSDSSS
jgi:hypothetical protein